MGSRPLLRKRREDTHGLLSGPQRILAPAKTPPDVVVVLEGALAKALAVKATQEKFLASGAELSPPELQTSKGFGDYIKDEFARTREAAKVAGLTPQ